MRALCLSLGAALLLALACMSPRYVTAPPAQVQSQPAQAPAAAAAEGSQELVADGVAAISNGDKGVARDNAIEDAKRKAVEQGVGSVLTSESKVENFQLVYDKISSKATGYVSSYSIVSEQSDSSLYRVTIRAVVRMADLQNDISGILNMVETQGRPRIMVLIRDTKAGTDEADPDLVSDLETMVIDSFVSKGFPVVDEEMVKQNLTNDQVKLILSGDDTAAADLGRKIGAEIVVAGTATATEQQASDPYTNQVRTVYSTKLNVRTINTRTSEILSATVVNQSAPFSRDAARVNTANEASTKLMSDILNKWQTQDIVTQVFCTNADGAKLQALKSGLSTRVRDVTSVILRDFTDNVGTIEVLAKSNSQDVFDVLNQSGWGVSFSLKGFSGNRIDLEFVTGGGK